MTIRLTSLCLAALLLGALLPASADAIPPQTVTDLYGGGETPRNKRPRKVCIQKTLKRCLRNKRSLCDGLNLKGWKQCKAKTYAGQQRLCSKKGPFGYCLAYHTSRSYGRMICSKPHKKFRRKCKWKCQRCTKYAFRRKNVCIQYEIKCTKKAKTCSRKTSYKGCAQWGQYVCHKVKLKCTRFRRGVCRKIKQVCVEKRRICKKYKSKKLTICSKYACLTHSYSCKKKGIIYVTKK